MSGSTLFIIMVFVTVILLMQGLVVPVFGDSAQARKRLQKRLESLENADEEPTYTSLVRKKHLKKLLPFERVVESLPPVEALAKLIEQAGHSIVAYRLIVLCLVLGVAAGYVAWYVTRLPVAVVAAGAFVFYLPLMKVRRDRQVRFARLEEQLPDAIDIMKRALKAGHPFTSTLKLVAQDMDAPIAREFEITFNDISYGNDMRRAMLGLLARVPSVTVMALVTSILVQKETGGNLAEVLEQIAKVIRGRFRFQRKVQTYTAEGRMSAWVLAMVPLVLFAVIWFTTPDYLPILVEDPRGRKMIVFGCISGLIGIAWIRRIIRIEV